MPKAKEIVSDVISDTETSTPVDVVVENKSDEPEYIMVPTDYPGQFNKILFVKPQIKNTKGEDVDIANYFYAKEGERVIPPPFFNKASGYPVTDREDLIEVFDKVFHPKDNFVLLKSRQSEVYYVLVPLRYSNINASEDSVLGDFQLHSMSFIADGGVNLDKFRMKLLQVAQLCSYVYER